ncbi:MAG TPA: glycoside hydrolase family 28 protein [Candidatus Methylacidiphilales bacterium]|nr:glycoside hydrolase family 28 protein [Candidatus Methylacidiphilales bacterium]
MKKLLYLVSAAFVVLVSACLLLPLFRSPVMAEPGTNRAYFNIRDYGAVGDGKTLDSPAIDKAINACAATGGGTVFFPAGTYLSGSIHLKSNIHLYLDAGCVVLGAPQSMKVYDPAEPFQGPAYQDGGHTFFHNSLIWGENLVNVSITGPGMIRGGAAKVKGDGLVSGDGMLDQWDGFAKPKNGSSPVALSEDDRRVGNKAICLKLCRNCLIRDVTIFHGGHFAILVTGCNGLTIDNVTIDTNRDGMDIDCCQNTAVSNCRINSPNDDGLCPKSTFALGHNVLTENLTISNCQVSGFAEGTLLDGTMKPSKSKTGRIKFGTEATGGFRNCTITNCTFRDCRGLALEEVDGGIMQNITVSNLSMMGIANCPIYITTGSRNRGAAGNPPTPSIAKNILISNVVANVDSSTSGIQITGIPGQPIEGVRLDNIRITFKGGGTKENAARVPKELATGYPEPQGLGVMPAYGLFARHVKDLELANVHVSFDTNDMRPAMSCIDVDGLGIDNFKASLASGVPIVKFDSVKNLVVFNSPEIPSQDDPAQAK